jgi:hypothetical protein
MTDPVTAILSERKATHGPFALNAAHSQQIKRQMQAAPAWETLHDVHKEALHMIALKLSRILSGQADFEDHWHDIAGYANLASKACKPPG